MSDFTDIQALLVEEIDLSLAPVAMSFHDAAPEGVERFCGSVAAGCTFWRLAATGEGFYTQAADHFNCAIGSYTHGIDLPESRADELPDTLGLMFEQGYLREEEVAGIPRLNAAPAFIAYRPLAACTQTPELVMLRGPADQLMLAQEAATRAGLACNAPLLGRPTCMAIPASISNGTTASTGCIGNRVYTDTGAGELYLAVPGRDIEALANALPTIVAANQALADYHQHRRETLERL